MHYCYYFSCIRLLRFAVLLAPESVSKHKQTEKYVLGQFWEGGETVSSEPCTITLTHPIINICLNVLSHHCLF